MTLRDIFLTLLCILIWGGNFIAIKFGVNELPPLVMITLRFLTTSLVFLPFMKWPGKSCFWKIAEVGLWMGAIHQGLLFVALEVLDASTVVILLQAQIMFAALLGWLILKESLHWRTGFGLLFGFSGLLIVLGGPDSQNLWGCFITLLSALAVAISFIRMRQLKNVHAPTFIVVINGASLPFVFAASLILAPAGWAELPRANWFVIAGVLAFQALIVSIAHILWQSLLARNFITKVTCFILLLPVVTIALSVALLGEDMHISLIWGGLLTILGVGIITIRKTQKRQPVQVDPAA
ncbi:MAG: DMT family transporter [Micavibrio aeruginosavorus]|uniref:DMT family transporter n=1 Tax=Micavibrio aeruginosavorus TaxID=349221 RepID=A0A7T5UHT4_9BACT|nr:MAG: DMT family transporter [Micavibrio aeruginosavorus]